MIRNKIQIAALLAVSLGALAQQDNSSAKVYHAGNEWIEESTGVAQAGRVVRIKTAAGSLQVRGAAQENITYRVRKHVRVASEKAARREFANLRAYSGNSGETTLIRGEVGDTGRSSIDLDVTVPSGTTLVRLETGGGGIAANGVTGKVEANTSGGGIRMDQIGGLVSVTSAGGNVEIGKVGGDLHITTGGGNIQINSAAGEISANTGGGGVTVGTGKGMVLQTGAGNIVISGACNGRLQATTGGGNIKIFQVDGGALLRTGGGGINTGRIQGGVRAETGAGAIVAELGAGGTPFTDSRLETPVGDIIVYVPDNLGVTIRAAVQLAHGDGIISDFSEIKITRSTDTYGPREAYAEGNLNGGGPVLHVHTNTGSIEFRRKK